MTSRFALRRLPSRSTTFADDVRAGLTATQKSLPPRWFYDALGSALFSAITNLPEYYVTRTEESILRANGAAIVEAMGGPVSLVELGSGDSRKTRLLIEALLARQGTLVYQPIDIDPSVLESTARQLLADFPALAINRMTLRAQVAEDGLATIRVADVFAKISTHLGRDLFAFGIPFLANFAERFFNGPERIAIVAFQNLPQVIRIEHALWQFVREHGIEKFPRPAFALHD